MAARPDSVCRFVCEAGDWLVTNLQLQKILYLSQMLYWGMEGDRLADLSFEAWDHGPVAPMIYRRVRMFGASPIEDVFDEARPFAKESKRHLVLRDACKDLLPLRPGQLVGITHWSKGAWARHYEPGARGIRIPDSSILEEYHARVAEGNIKADQRSC